MKTTEHLSVTLGQQTLNWLSLSYLLMVLPLYGELHAAIYACALLTIGWRYAIAREQLKPPSLWLLRMASAPYFIPAKTPSLFREKIFS